MLGSPSHTPAMTATATFTLLPIDRLEALCVAAEAGQLTAFRKSEGKTAAPFAGDGRIFGTVFAYLDEVHGINLSSSEYDETTARVSEATGSSCFLLTLDHRNEHYDALDLARFPKAELQEFHDDVNETEQPGAGAAMWNAIRALRESMSRLDETRVTLLEIG